MKGKEVTEMRRLTYNKFCKLKHGDKISYYYDGTGFSQNKEYKEVTVKYIQYQEIGVMDQFGNMFDGNYWQFFI